MKSGFAVLIGRSNVGKSTLLNALIGTKVAITTPKPQTTRMPIQGVMTSIDSQVVFVDTPGIMQKAKDPLTKKLLDWTRNSLEDIDAILYVVDATRDIGNEEKQVMKMIEHIEKPKLLVINKIDDSKSRRYIDFYRDLAEQFDGYVEISAKHGSNVDVLKRWIHDHIPEGEFMYPEGQFSNLTSEQQIAEIIREKLFLRLRQEVPYQIHVVVDEFSERDNGTMYVKARILTINKRYQGMVIGKGARGIKEIGQSTRRELETISGKKWFLDLHVEVDAHWIDRMTY